jgi:hypothetical protein
MSDDKPKDFMDPAQLIKILAALFQSELFIGIFGVQA